MKHLFAKWLAALLIAALLLTPVAMMEEAPAGEPVVTDPVNTDETPAEPDAAPEDDAAPAEPDETPDEPDETPAEPDDTEEEADEEIVAEAFEADVEETSDVELDGEDADFTETFEEEVSLVESDALYTTTGVAKTAMDPNLWAILVDWNGNHYDQNGDDVLSPDECAQITRVMASVWENDPSGNMGSYNTHGITSLAGIENFTNLEMLYCDTIPLGGTLDVSVFPNLTELHCYNCGLTGLTLGTLNNLGGLQCANNNLQTLDISGCPQMLSIATDAYKQNSGFYQKEEKTNEGWSKWYMLSYDGTKTTLLLANGQSIAPEPVNGGGQGGQGLSIELNSTNFPDPALLAALKAFDDDNNDILSMAENEKVTALDLSGTSFSNPTGMENLHWLKELNVSDCASLTDLSRFEYGADGNLSKEILPESIKKLNASNCTNLKILQYGESNLSELNVTGCTNLEELGCNYDRNLTSLDVSTCKNLKRLYIGWTKLTAVPKLANNDLLEELNCSELGLTALNPGDYPNLNILSCGGNGLSQLDISGCATLTTLDCWGNTFSELNLSNNKKLAELWCEGNPNLKTLDISNCEVLNAAVDPNAPKDVDYDNDGNPDCVGYGPYVDEYNNNGWRLTCDKGVTIITKKAEEPAPAPAPAPVASAPAPATHVITATAKNTKTGITAAPGTTAQLDLGGAAGKSFKSSNKKVATVDQNGNITFRKAGKVKITFKVGKKKRTVTIKVTDPTIPTSVTVTPATTDVKKGDQVTLTPVIPEGTNTTFKWKTSNKKVATVKNGVVTFKKKGKVTITCTAKRGGKKTKVKFSVGK